MKYKVARFEKAGADACALQQGCEPFCRFLVFRKQKHGAFRYGASIDYDFCQKGIACAALQSVYNEGERLLRMQLLLNGKSNAFILAVKPYQLGNSHRLMGEAAHCRINLAAHDKLRRSTNVG